jgi:hypothetical protein
MQMIGHKIAKVMVINSNQDIYQIQASFCKKLARPHINKHARNGDPHL